MVPPQQTASANPPVSANSTALVSTAKNGTGACPAGSRWQAAYGGYCAPDRAPLAAIDATIDTSKLAPEDVKSLLDAAKTWQIDKLDKDTTRGLDRWDVKQLKQSLKDCNTKATPASCEDVASKLRTPDPDFDSFDFTVQQAHYQVYQALFRACALANSQSIADDNGCSSLAEAIGTPAENLAAALAAIDDSPSCALAAKKSWPDWCVSSAFFSVPGNYHGYSDLPLRIQKVGEDVCRRAGRGCGSLTAWKNMQAAPTDVASAASQDDSSPQSNAQDIQDKIDSLNNEIQQLESDANDADQNADNLATNSNCTGGFGAYAQIAQQGCENINSIGVAKFRSEAAKDRNQADDDRAEIERLQGEEVQEAPHRDASFGNALAQQTQRNPQPSIVDTANQQAANMVAVGAANDAARAQDAQRAEQQREQQAQQQAQPAERTAPSQRVPDLPAGCITVSESDRGEANFGAWVFTNNCGVRVSIVVTAPPNPQVTGNPYDVYQSDSLDAGQSLRGPQANQRYKYFACPSPFAPYDSSTSAGHIVNPSYETNTTVCLQVDASGDILAH